MFSLVIDLLTARKLGREREIFTLRKRLPTLDAFQNITVTSYSNAGITCNFAGITVF